MYDVGKHTMFEVGVVRSKVQADALKLGEGGDKWKGEAEMTTYYVVYSSRWTLHKIMVD